MFTDDTSIMDVAMQYVPVGIVVFVSNLCRCPMNALINGSGNYKVNFAVAILDGFVMRIGMALLLGIVFGLGYVGFWLGDAIAGFTPFVVGVFYLVSGSWKTRKYAVSD